MPRISKLVDFKESIIKKIPKQNVKYSFFLRLKKKMKIFKGKIFLIILLFISLFIGVLNLIYLNIELSVNANQDQVFDYEEEREYEEPKNYLDSLDNHDDNGTVTNFQER
jgi:cytoskeletal protein RodZ